MPAELEAAVDALSVLDSAALGDGETLQALPRQLERLTTVATRAVAAWLGAAGVERIVFDGPDRIRNVGVRRRIFAGAARRAVEVRDRECFSEFCEEVAEDCEIDHVQPWAAGGLTVDDNGRPACSYHNRWRYRRGPPA